LKNKQLFEDTIEYKEVSKFWHDLDVVMLGIGTYPSVPDQATAARFGTLLRQKKAVGMLATYYFDVNGNLIESKDDIVIRISLDDLHRAGKVIVIGAGTKKITAIRGILKTGIVTHLITDDKTAQSLIEHH
jgi:deoxyribonucleoside regulator